MRNNILRVRFSNDEFENLKKLSDDAGMSMSVLVRDHLEKVKVRDKSEERQRNINLNRINSNLNMIAKWVVVTPTLGEGGWFHEVRPTTC